MSRLITVHRPEALVTRTDAGLLPALDQTEFGRPAPDAHVLAMASDGSTAGRCSLWWRKTPPLPGERVGIVGYYAALDAEGRL